jgi:hypothetical protein
MKLSDSERAFVIRQKKRQGIWRWMRWFHLGASSLLVLASGVNLIRLLSLGVESMEIAVSLSWFAPFCWLTFCASALWLGNIVFVWRGDVRTALFLRLVDEHDEQKKGVSS